MNVSQRVTFRMVIEDIFTIRKKGVIVVGKVLSGDVSTGESVMVTGGDKPSVFVERISIPMFNPPLHSHVEILLNGVQRDQIEVGMIVTTEDTSQKS